MTARDRSASSKAVALGTMDVLSWLLSGWYLMLLVGIVHLDWLPRVPTISYGLALLIMLFINGILDSAAARSRFAAKQVGGE